MPQDVARRAWVARGAALGTLALSIALYVQNWSYSGPLYWGVHVVAIGGIVAVTAPLRRAPDGVCRALIALALLLPLTSAFGFALVAWCGPDRAAAPSGSPPQSVTIMLERSWVVWLPMVVFVVAALIRRRTGLREIGLAHAAATCMSVAAAPPALVATSLVVAAEFMRGGAAVLVVYPLLGALVATALSWIQGTPSPAARALRRFTPVLALLATLAATVLVRPEATCDGRWLADWGVVSLRGLGAFIVVVALGAALAVDPPARGAA
jgi:hypothetical protein